MKLSLTIFLLLLTAQAYSQKEENILSSEEDVSAASSLLTDFAPLELNVNPERESRNCETVDLSEEFRQRNLPDRRHQDSTGWCYAFVAADLVSFEVSRNVSPAWLARQYLNYGSPNHLLGDLSPLAQSQPLGGGFTQEAIELTRANDGFCVEEEFPSEDYSQSLSHSLLVQIEEDDLGTPSKRAEDLLCLDTARIAPLYNQIPIQNLLSLVRSNDFRLILNNLANSQCTTIVNLPSETRVTRVIRVKQTPYDTQDNDEFINSMDNVLSSNKPLSISIDSAAFTPNPRNSIRRGNATHQVIAMGRRFNQSSGQCEYLIRNSEGNCESYNQNFECNNGHFWMSREMVRMASAAADFIN